MNIGINTRLLIDGKVEGIARYIFEISSRMAAAHPEHTFYYFFDRKFDKKFITSENIKPVVVQPASRHPILWNIWFQYQIPRFIKKFKIDVFYTGETYLPRKTKVPCAIVSHDLAYCHYPEQIPKHILKYYKKNFPKNHRLANAIIAVSEFTKQDIVNQYSIKEGRVKVIHNAAPSGFKALTELEKSDIQKELTAGHPYFAYLGSFHPRKNILGLISAYNAFKNKTKQDHKLVLLGRWAWKTEEIKEKINTSPFTEDIIVRQETRANIFRYVAGAEALLYISLFEGFGIPILEGFSAGVPVITSNVSSMPEVGGTAAYSVNPQDPNEIAAAMEECIRYNPEREQRISAGYKQLEKFSWDKSAKQTYSILENLINN